MEVFLTFRRSDFIEIYYLNNNGSWFLNKTTNKSIIFLLLSLLGLFISIIFNYAQHIIPIIIIIFGFVLFDLASKFYIYYKWRKEINSYLDSQEKYKRHRIEITNNYLTIEQDEEATIERFDQIKTCAIHKDFIRLSGDNNFLIPRKSMTDDEYSRLSTILKERIKNMKE